MFCLRPTDYNSDPLAAILRQIPRNRLHFIFIHFFALKIAFKVIFLHPEPYKHLFSHLYIFFIYITGRHSTSPRTRRSTFYLQMVNVPKRLISNTILKSKYKKRMTF